MVFLMSCLAIGRCHSSEKRFSKFSLEWGLREIAVGRFVLPIRKIRCLANVREQ